MKRSESHEPRLGWFLLSTVLACAPAQLPDGPTGPTEDSVGGAIGESDDDLNEEESRDGAGDGADGSPAAPDGDGDGTEDPPVLEEDGAPGDGGDGPVEEIPPAVDCSDETARAALLIEDRCGSCHAGGRSFGGFGVADDADAMIARGFVRLGDLNGSELYEITESGEMPEGSPRFDAQELSTLEAWILCVPDGVTPPPDDGAVDDDDDDDDDDDEDEDEDEDEVEDED
jgi:hypothetical protein